MPAWKSAPSVGLTWTPVRNDPPIRAVAAGRLSGQREPRPVVEAGQITSIRSRNAASGSSIGVSSIVGALGGGVHVFMFAPLPT